MHRIIIFCRFSQTGIGQKYGGVSFVFRFYRVSLFFDIPFQEFCQETDGVAPAHVPELACVRIPGDTSFSRHQP